MQHLPVRHGFDVLCCFDLHHVAIVASFKLLDAVLIDIAEAQTAQIAHAFAQLPREVIRRATRNRVHIHDPCTFDERQIAKFSRSDLRDS